MGGMDQTTARRLAKVLSDEGPGIFVALSEEHYRGEWDKPDSKWIVVRPGVTPIYRSVPEGVKLPEAPSPGGDVRE